MQGYQIQAPNREPVEVTQGLFLCLEKMLGKPGFTGTVTVNIRDGRIFSVEETVKKSYNGH